MLHFDAMSIKSSLPKAMQPTRRFKKRWLFLVMLLIIIGIALFAWSQRIAIVDRALRDQLEDYDVAVEYEIVEIGPRFQRLRNIIIGDPDNPDFTAKEVDIDLKVSFTGAVLRTIWVRGGYLRGRYKEGELSFGKLDSLLETDDDVPFEFPDLALDIANSKMRLNSDWGLIGIGLSGRGHLQRNFNGALAVKSNRLDINECIINNSRYTGQIKISNQKPSLDGWFTHEDFECAVGDAAGISIAAQLDMSEDFKRWRGNADILLDSVKNDGIAIRDIAAKLEFSGNLSRTDLQYELQKSAFTGSGITINNMQTQGEARLSISEDGYNLAALGDASIAGASAEPSTIDTLRSYRNIADNSPIAPLLRIWAPALAQSASNFSTNMGYDIALGDTVNNRNIIILNNAELTSKSGVHVSLSDNIKFEKPSKALDWRIKSPIGFALRGGKLPNLTAKVEQGQGNLWTGEVEMPAYRAGTSLLALNDVKFNGSLNGGWNFSGSTVMSGAIPSGRVERLSLPIDGQWKPDGKFEFLTGCKNISFAMLQASDFRLQNQNIEICPDGRNAIVNSDRDGIALAGQIQNLSIAATLGKNPISIQSDGIVFSLKDGLIANDVRLDIGESDNLSSFAMAQLTANFNGQTIAGIASDGKAKIGAVPLDMDQAQLNWQYENAILSAKGSLLVRDAEQVDRFNPLSVPDLILSLENGEISALAEVQEPSTGRKIAIFDLKHILSDTTGRALFSVDDLTFDAGFQPELLSNIVLGVIANVQGAVNGDGVISWNGSEVKSRGKFSTNDMDLAAAFGPIEGLTGEIKLTDLINITSEDRQIVNIASVNPGIDVRDGRISYQLLPGQKVQIHGGSWPFAGGRLILEPTIWDFADDVDRALAFEVTNADAALFLQQYDFANLSASGIFSGRFPMIFNSQGGRIIGGSLVSQSGGNVSYIGDLTYEDLSLFGNYAFNSLRSIDYKELEIELGGDIAGEIVTSVRFSGLSQGEGAQQNFITKQIAKIPLQFNVRIEASFLELINIANGYYDPASLVNIYRPDLLIAQNSNNDKKIRDEQAVQPVESKDSP